MPTLALNNTELYFRDDGPKTAPPILLLHSLFFDSRMFEFQIAHFSDRFRVIAPDQRGHGQSPHPKDGRYDMDTLTDDVIALIQELKLGPVHVVGNSMGGFIAIRLAARHRDHVRSLSVVGSSADKEHKIEEYRPLVQALKENGGAPVIEPLMYTMFGDTTLADPSRAELRRLWRDRMSGLPKTIGYAAEAVVERSSVVDELRDIVAPVLAIAAREDHAYAVDLSEQIARETARGSFLVVEKAGHSTCLEAPHEVNSALSKHFASADLVQTV